MNESMRVEDWHKPVLPNLSNEVNLAAGLDVILGGPGKKTKIIWQWISVKDRLPSPLEPVLIIDEDGEMLVAIWRPERFKSNGAKTNNPAWQWGDGHYQIAWGNVTHWMPLPEAPSDAEVESKNKPQTHAM